MRTTSSKPPGLLGVLMTALIALAATTPVRADEAAVRAAMQRAFPQNQVRSITKTPVAGMFEVAIGDRLLYVTDSARFIFGGPLLDVERGLNLTEASLAQMNAIPFASLPFELAFKWVNGKGTREIAIFEDPDCPYCKKFEQTLRSVDDLTVHVFLYPIEQLHPEAVTRSRAIWCAPDPAAAWKEVMKSGRVPEGVATCETPLEKIAELARQHRISGTPTTVLANGRRLVGAVDRAEFEAQLMKASKP